MQSDTFDEVCTASLSRCARCGSSDLEDKDVEKLVRGDDDVAVLRVSVTVCHHCGERYLLVDAVRALEHARRDLQTPSIRSKS